MSGDGGGLREAADTEITLWLIDDKGEAQAIKAMRLRPFDLAQATEFLFERRTERQTKAAVKTNLALEQVRDMHARTLATIQCTAVSAYDVVCDPMGRIKLAQLAINRAGEQKLTFEKTCERLAHVDLDDFFWTLCYLSGIYKLADRFKKPETPDPLATSVETPTSKPSTE